MAANESFVIYMNLDLDECTNKILVMSSVNPKKSCKGLYTWSKNGSLRVNEVSLKRYKEPCLECCYRGNWNNFVGSNLFVACVVVVVVCNCVSFEF